MLYNVHLIRNIFQLFLFFISLSFAHQKKVTKKRCPKIQLNDFASHVPLRFKAQSPSARAFLGFANAQRIVNPLPKEKVYSFSIYSVFTEFPGGWGVKGG